MDIDINARLKNKEDGLVERKPESLNERELRKELVAFANSVPDEVQGIIFIGVADDGTILGVANSDEKQKKIRRVAEQDCYPPIDIQMLVISEQGLDVIAVIVPASKKRPHFTGHAYVRIGSECKSASELQYEELINSRSDVCREILKNKDAIFTIRTINKKLGVHSSENRPYAASYECRVVECNQHNVRLHDISTNEYFSEPLGNIQVTRDEKRHRPMLLVTNLKG